MRGLESFGRPDYHESRLRLQNNLISPELNFFKANDNQLFSRVWRAVSGRLGGQTATKAGFACYMPKPFLKIMRVISL